MSVSAAFAGSIPKCYEEGMGPIIFQPYAEELAGRVPSDAKKVLELAAGTGRLTSELCKRLSPDALINATDINPDMLAVAQRQVSDSRVTWETADAQALPFEDASFDAALCQFGVMFYKDRVLGHREAFRVLRPGGRYLFNAWNALPENPWAATIHQAMSDLFPDNQPGFFAIPFSYHDPELVRADVAAAGFEDIRIEHVEKEVFANDALRLARGGVEGSPLAAALTERGISDFAPIVEEIRLRFVRNFGNFPMRSSMQALVITATRSGR